ncbi:MAG: hypothetical protein EOP36_14470 [Rubrivivax sp.]|nr:MAG: hypothetical protein EOP36_14470 [Rubrivivax sp.]
MASSIQSSLEHPGQPPHPGAAPPLQSAEQAALQTRRRRVLGDASAQAEAELTLPRVGLALSGGGVRSATFALGLMRGLAQNRRGLQDGVGAGQRTLDADGLLGRLDYLSTVSGGGYIGGMFGRLVSSFGMARAQALMADASSPVLEWLRRNGRYLSTSGSRDWGTAVVTYLRAVLAIHAEFMVACMLLGLIVVAPHLWQHSAQVLDPKGWAFWQTPWWVLALAGWLITAPGLISGYWSARDTANPGARSAGLSVGDGLFLLGCGFGTWVLVHWSIAAHLLDPWHDGLTATSAAVLALLSITGGQLLAQGWLFFNRDPHALAVARLRNALTRALRMVTLGVCAVAGLGALDVLSWWLLEELQSQAGNENYLWRGVGFGGLVALGLRTLVQPLQQMAAEAGGRTREWLPRLINVGSLAGLLALVLGWLVLLQWFVFAPDTFAPLINTPSWMRAGLVGVVWFTWVALTAGNAQMPNTSSLHSFYRARLTRAYLAVGNPRRGLEGGGAGRADVTAVEEGDDVGLRHYQPELRGGPIHLVNTCLNQTRDDLSGLYNADRKGAAVTATWRGLEVGPSRFIPMQPDHDAGTLGRWVAVSGAAASPGAGAYTTRGLALLLYFLGVRLGHWVRSPGAAVPLRWLSHWSWRLLPKPLMLASEASAVYFGGERPWWYLSDGGHFENTGVYALLKRELDFIILSDASCDPRYEFGDIENLVRKARIDFGAEIDFYSGEEASRLFTSDCEAGLTVLSPEDVANNHSCRGVLLARIRYRERLVTQEGGAAVRVRPEGTLLVVKPNLHKALDVDVLAYAQKHEDFPHESTGDQSFDEAQWESYHRLGEDFGLAMHETWLAQLPGWRNPAHHGIRVAARLHDAQDAQGKGQAVPWWRRTARATAIGATLGLGASGTLVLSAWQVIEQVQRKETESRTEASKLFAEVSKGLQSVDAHCPKMPEYLYVQTKTLLQVMRGSPLLSLLEREGVDLVAARIATDFAKPPDAAQAECPATSLRMRSELQLVASFQPASSALSYWDSGTSPGVQALAADAVWRQLKNWSAKGPLTTATVNREPAQVPTPAAVPTAAPTVAVAPSSVSLEACRRSPGNTLLYVQIYDEFSRGSATALRQALQAKAGELVQVAPIENVTLSAQVRQQRRPAPWPKPTFVLHDPASQACAKAMSGLLGLPWVAPGDGADKVWVRELPKSLNRRPGVIELWLPPSVQQTSSTKPPGAGPA